MLHLIGKIKNSFLKSKNSLLNHQLLIKRINGIFRILGDNAVYLYCFLFGLSFSTVILMGITLNYYTNFRDIWVEMHGMVFDILILGIFFSIIQGKAQKEREIKILEEEIEAYKDWGSEEAAHLIIIKTNRLKVISSKAVNLSSCNFSKLDIKNLNFSKTNLKQAKFKNAKIKKANFIKANLRRTNFEKVKILEGLFNGAYLEYAYLMGAMLKNAKFEDAECMNANFIDAQLNGAKFQKADLSDVNFTNSNMIGANLTEANLSKANLIGANLTGANLSGANLSEASLIGADLTSVKLKNADFTGADLTGACMKDVEGLEGQQLSKSSSIYQIQCLSKEIRIETQNFGGDLSIMPKWLNTR